MADTGIIKRGRKLVNKDEVFTQNAWDDTEWTKEMLDEAEDRIKQQKLSSTNDDIATSKIEQSSGEKWNDFYKAHGDKFFKDRQWIFSEFPEILSHLKENSDPCNIFEVGCGVGNAVTHIISSNANPNLQIYCCDLSQKAIDTLKSREMYKLNEEKITAFQADVCHDFDRIICDKVSPGSLDFIMLVFTLSALKPELMKSTIANLATRLRSGGMLLFRDYARYDLTQLRFKGCSYLRENYYVRADGTTSYFFTKPFIEELFTSCGLEKVELNDDNRMLVNRLKSLKMCRCWIQAKFRKIG